MGTTIIYCDRCKERVPPRDIQQDRVLTFQGQNYCGKCAEALRPTLEQDPAYQEELRQRKAAEVESTKRSVQGKSRIGRARTRASTASFAQTAVARPKRGGSRRRPASGTSRRDKGPEEPKAGPKAGPPPWFYAVIGLAGGLLVAAAAVVMMRPDAPTPVAEGSGSGAGSGSETTPGAGSGSPAAIDHKRLTLEALRDRIARYERDSPEEYGQLLERWRQYRLEAADYPELARAAEARIEAVKDRRDRAGAAHFAELKKQALALADAGRWAEASAVWDDFDERFRSKSWTLKIDFERDELRRQRKAWEREQAGKFEQGEIPSDGYMASIWNGRDLEDWRFLPKAARSAFRISDGVLHVDNDRDGLAMICPVVAKPTGGAMQLKDYYLGFDFRIERGGCVLLFRVPLNPRRGGAGQFTLEADGPNFQSGRWYSAHMILRGDTVQFWVVGALARNTMKQMIRPQGRMMFGARKGDHYKLRNIKLRVLSEGDTYTPGVVPPMKKTPFDVLASISKPAELKGARNIDNWTLSDGVLTMTAGPKPGTSGFLMDLAKSPEFSVDFQVRGLDGTLAFALRAPKGQRPAFAPLRKEHVGSDRERWRAIKIEVVGAGQGQLVATVHVDGKRLGRVKVPYNSGPSGLLLDGQRCQIRKLVVTSLE